MTSRDPKAAVRQHGRLSSRQLGFLLRCGSDTSYSLSISRYCSVWT